MSNSKKRTEFPLLNRRKKNQFQFLKKAIKKKNSVLFLVKTKLCFRFYLGGTIFLYIYSKSYVDPFGWSLGKIAKRMRTEPKLE